MRTGKIEATGARRRPRRVLALAAVVATTVAGCGGRQQQDVSSGTTPAPPRAAIAVESFAFVPARLHVDLGAEVTWTNRDMIEHTVTTGTAGEQGVPGVSVDTPAEPDGVLDGRLNGRGRTTSFAFDEAGRYDYYCSLHAGMTGTVLVADR